MGANNGGFAGQANFATWGSDFNVIDFLIGQRLAKANSAAVVAVVAVTNAGGVSPVGFVDVQPLINQIDGDGNIQPHGVIHGLPYCRIQGGANAIILDPQVGDRGLVVYCDRDISLVKANSTQSPPQPVAPGSRRQNDYADGVYVGGILNGTPTQYIQFAQNDGSPNGIAIVSPVAVTVQAPNATVNASEGVTVTTPTMTVNGNLNVTGDVIAGYGSGDDVGLQTHKHPTAATGAPSSPTPGT